MAMNDQQASAYLDSLCAALGGASHDLAARRADGRSNGHVEITMPDGTAFSVHWGGYAYKDRSVRRSVSLTDARRGLRRSASLGLTCWPGQKNLLFPVDISLIAAYSINHRRTQHNGRPG